MRCYDVVSMSVLHQFDVMWPREMVLTDFLSPSCEPGLDVLPNVNELCLDGILPSTEPDLVVMCIA